MLRIDHRQVSPGDTFIAMQGSRVDGHDFVPQAIEQGATTIYAERPLTVPETIDCHIMPDLRTQLGAIANDYFHQPSLSLGVTAVTGTNGKTSVCHLLTQMQLLLGAPAHMIGTLGHGSLDNLVPFGNTTPDSILLHQLCAQARDQGIDYLNVEASSHGLVQGRLNELAVDYAVYTNLAEDHLDYHHTLSAYASAKSTLFRLPGLQAAFINQDDAFADTMIAALDPVVPCYRYSVSGPADITASDIRADSGGFAFYLSTPWGCGVVRLPLLGRYQVENSLPVLAILLQQGYVLPAIIKAAAQLQPVPGRMNRIVLPVGAQVIIDYATTAEALACVLSELRDRCTGRLTVVFGCGGDRTRSKRAPMGAVVDRYADVAIVTHDNPRFEDPDQIAADICAGFLRLVPQVIHDRAYAIEQAITMAAADDMILLAAKGHEKRIEIQGRQVPFDETLCILKSMSFSQGADDARDRSATHCIDVASE